MPRGVHANSRANLAGAAGGDRWADKRAMVATIRNALEVGFTSEEVRAFFGLRPAQLVKQKHRARMAKVKAPLVYDAMVRGFSDSIVKTGFDPSMIERMVEAYRQELLDEYSADVESGFMTLAEAMEEIEAELDGYRQMLEQQPVEKDYGVLSVRGFMRARAVRQEAKYPVRIYRTGEMVPIGEHQLTYLWAYYMGAVPGFNEYPSQVKREGLAWVSWYWYAQPGVGGQSARGPLHMIAVVDVPRAINIRMFFEDSGQVEDREVDLAPGRVFAYIIDEYSNYWVPYPELSEYVPVARYCTSFQDAQQIAEAWGGSIPHFWDAMGTEEFDALMGIELDGWNYEFESFGERMGGSPERIAQFFPRRQRVSGELDPINGRMVYSDVKYLDAGEWNWNFQNMRGQYLAAGAIVPPENPAPSKLALSVTFDPDFIAGIQDDPPAEGPPA